MSDSVRNGTTSQGSAVEAAAADRVFGVLFSHACIAVFPELVCDERFGSRTAASFYGQDVARAQGVEFEVMALAGDGQWRNLRGESAVEVIRRRWGS